MSDATIHPFEAALAAAWPPHAWRDVTVLAAVSGGPDSVALLRALAAIKDEGPGRLAAGHFNHQLRGEESAADEAFVRDLSRQLGVVCHVGRAESRPAPGGIEASARRERYAFLGQTAAQLGARYVVAAHTADDQAETILHRILRGTAIRGLTGMARTRRLGHASLIRPMLAIRRVEVLAYLGGLGQPFRQDSSNRDTRFTRNRIRHELLPRLAAEFNREIAEALLRLGSLAAEVQAVIDPLAEALLERSVSVEGPNTVHFELAALAGQPRYLVRELFAAVWRRRDWPLRSMGYAEWDRLADLVSPGDGSSRGAEGQWTLPGNVLVRVGPARATLTRLGSAKE